MMKLYLCEKPSQAGDIAAVLGNRQKRDGYYETADGTVTWCLGHLLEQLAPEDYRPEWKSWNFDALPICPDTWKVQARKDTKAQLKAVQGLVKRATSLVIATDADREGEMIAREILDYCGYRGPVSRLWLSALDPESVKRALSKLKPGRETEPLYRAALARSRADWLVGLNLTRAATTALGNGAGVLSVGRVQTPTLALVVRRDEAIENFKPRDYFELLADVVSDNGHKLTLRHAPGDEDRMYERAKAEALAAQATGARAPLSVESERLRQAPPKLFSLLSLQATANKRWGWSADKTLKVAQALYETHKATSYPRSDCPYLPNEQEADVPAILGHLAGVSELATVARLDAPQIRKAVFDSKKITAHHAIIPTSVAAPWSGMSEDERALYLLVARHYLAALSPDHEYQHTVVVLDANGVLFKATGRVPLVPGWRAVFGADVPEDDQKKDDAAAEALALPPVENGEHATAEAARVDAKRTTPPARYTEGTLLKDMAAVAKYVDDPGLKARLKETSGIGTEATRAAILELLKKRGFLEPKGKTILSTDTGRALIHRLPAGLADPGETAVWEDRLEAIVRNEETVEGFLVGVNAKVAAQLAELRNAVAGPLAATTHACPACGKPMRRRNGTKGPFWGCSGYPECKTAVDDVKGRPGEPQAKAAPLGKACPECSKPLVIRNGRNGRFVSCSGYPECRHTENLEGEPARSSAPKKKTRRRAAG